MPNDNDSIEQTFIKALEQAKQYILPVLDNIVLLKDCIEHYMVYHSPIINIIPDEDDRECRNEGLLHFKIDDHSDMTREFKKALEVTKKMIKKDRHYDSVLAMRCAGSEEYRMELISKRDAIYNDSVVYQQVMEELERRRQANIEKIQTYGLFAEKKSIEKSKKLTLNAAFKQVFGEALEPLGFKKVKSKYPYYARLVNDEILHVITVVSRPDKRFEILGGIATVYRQFISLELNPKYNEMWLKGNFYYYGNMEIQDNEIKYALNEIYEFYGDDWLEKEMKRALNATKDIMIDIFDKVDSLDKCVEFYNFFGIDIRIHHKEDFGNSYPINYYNEGLLIVKTMNLEQYNSLIDKYNEITISRQEKQTANGGVSYDRLVNELELFKNQKVSKYKDLLNDKEWLFAADIELNNRRDHNIKLLKKYELI